MKLEAAMLLNDLGTAMINLGVMPSVRSWLDGFSVTVNGLEGDISCHSGTDWKLESYGAPNDHDDVTRFTNAKECAAHFLNRPV